jgi:hypothetical protein
MNRVWLTAVWGVALALSARPVLGAGASVLEADPPDTHVSVSGSMSVAGVAPLPIAQLPIGQYYLAAEGPGLPAIRGRFVISPEGVFGRSWAGPAAIVLPPGFVHLEHGETRGWALAGAGAAGGTMAIYSQASVRNAQDKVDRAERAYSWATSPEGIANTRWALLMATKERDDYVEIRNLWVGYLGVTWLAAGLEAVFLTPQPSFSSGGPGRCLVTMPRASGGRAALRSILIPGGGQRYMGRSTRANFFFTAAAALAASSIAAQDAFLEARRDQAQAVRRFANAQDESELDSARRGLEKAAERVEDKNILRWTLVGSAAGVYAWNILDALGLGQNAKIPGLTWSVTPSSDGFLMCATWSMP